MAEDEGASMISGIGQLVRLKEMLQKWQSLALTPRGNSPPSDHKFPSGISPAIVKRLKDDYILCDSDEDSCHSPSLPSDVPKGYLAVYVVGEELRRFIIPTDYLSHPVFKVLLKKVEEEFGFDHQGGLTVPCEIETFKYLLKCMETHHNLNISTNDEDDLRSVE